MLVYLCGTRQEGRNSVDPGYFAPYAIIRKCAKERGETLLGSATGVCAQQVFLAPIPQQAVRSTQLKQICLAYQCRRI